MKNSPLMAMSAVILSLVGTMVLFWHSAIEQSSTQLADSASLSDEQTAPALDPPGEIIEDLASHAWSQLESAIKKSSAENDTFVVWIVDESSSMSARRLEIADQIERAFGSQQNDSRHQLFHSLFSFGEGIHRPAEKWNGDAAQIASLFRNVREDTSGKEMTMTTVGQAANRLRSVLGTHRDWNRMFVIVTDERGDDYQHVEQVANSCSRLGIRIFCLGNASPFGTEKGFIRYTYDDGFQVDIPVDQGPETMTHQTLQIPIIGQPVTQLPHVSSGFGPYALEWLCRKTGGQFCIYEDNANHRFPPRRMSNCQPDYISIRLFQDKLDSNRARKALIDAVFASRESKLRIRPTVVRGDVHRVLREEITERQKECVFADQLVQKLMTILEPALEDRDALDSLRWRASFDLAWGQALAAKVRLGALNLRLAQMKVEPQEFKTPSNNTWTLIEASELREPSGQHIKLASQSRRILQQVVVEHPQTPFAHIAQRELDRGFGWKWVESHSDGPALTSSKRYDLEWQYRFGGRPKYLKPLPVPRKRLPQL